MKKASLIPLMWIHVFHEIELREQFKDMRKKNLCDTCREMRECMITE